MLTFNYTARDTTTNKVIKSTVQAESERSAAKLLMAQGIVPLVIVEQTNRANIINRIVNRVTAKDRIIFTRQLATLINAGLPLAQSLRTLTEQTDSKRLVAIINEIIASIEAGNSLAESFSKHPEVFNDVYLALIAAGEVSGTLDEALERIASQQEKDAELLSKVRGAMIYPAIVLVVIIGVVGFMLFTIIPQIERLYEDLGKELPIVTAVLVWMSEFSLRFWWLMLLLAIGAIYFLKRYVETDVGRKNYDTLKIRIPVFGNLFKKLYMARFTRTGQTLMASGVQMLEMLRITARAVNNTAISEAILRAADKVKGGKALSVSLKNEKYILSLVPQMIGIGEQSGGIDKMMGKAATYYENELDVAVRSISTAIEPVLMVFLAVIAGLMVAAILLPVYGLIGNLPGS